MPNLTGIGVVVFLTHYLINTYKYLLVIELSWTRFMFTFVHVK